jgi:hypothetical protein
MQIFFFNLLIRWVITSIDFWKLSIRGINPTWLWGRIFLYNVVFDLLIFVEHFCLYGHKKYWFSGFFFQVVPLSNFGSGVMVVSQKFYRIHWKVSSLLLCCWTDCRELVWFFLKCLVELFSTPIMVWWFISWEIIIGSITLLSKSLFRLSISYCVNIGRLCLSRDWFISSRLSNLWAESFILLIILLMSLGTVVLSFFHFRY